MDGQDRANQMVADALESLKKLSPDELLAGALKAAGVKMSKDDLKAMAVTFAEDPSAAGAKLHTALKEKSAKIEAPPASEE